MTGRDLKLTTPNDVLTARDSLEYWSQKHMAVARGDAVVVTNDGRRVAADTLVAYTTRRRRPPPARRRSPRPTPAAASRRSARRRPASCRRSRHSATSSIRTATDTVTRRPRASMCPTPASPGWSATCASRAGRTSSNGAEAEVNMKTGIARLLSRQPAAGCRAWSCRTTRPTSTWRIRRRPAPRQNDSRSEPRDGTNDERRARARRRSFACCPAAAA